MIAPVVHRLRAIVGFSPFGRTITCECGVVLPITWEDVTKTIAAHAAATRASA